MTLQAWLDGERDYEVGRLLYDHYGDNNRLKQVFGHGPNSYNCECLAWELSKLAKHVHDAGPPYKVGYIGNAFGFTGLNQPTTAPVVENATETLQTEPAAAPAESPLLVELREARRPLYDERTGVHGQLEHLDTDEQRREAAARIIGLSRGIDTNWNTTRYVVEHGQLPPPPPPPPGLDTLTPVELLKKRNSLRSQVSKLKNRLDRADDLAAVQATLSQVEALLKPAA